MYIFLFQKMTKGGAGVAGAKRGQPKKSPAPKSIIAPKPVAQQRPITPKHEDPAKERK